MNDQRDLEGIRALVTGTTPGIGRAAAEELGRHGAEIVVHGRDAPAAASRRRIVTRRRTARGVFPRGRAASSAACATPACPDIGS